MNSEEFPRFKGALIDAGSTMKCACTTSTTQYRSISCDEEERGACATMSLVWTPSPTEYLWTRLE